MDSSTVNNAEQLKLMSLNCNSLYNKLPEVKQLLIEEDPDILCLCETWTKEKYLPKFKNYKAEWKHRTDRGGGLAILVNTNLQYQTIQLREFEQGVLEVQALEIYLGDSSPLQILNVYNPVKNMTYQEIDHYISQLSNKHLIIGDFNAHTPLLDTNTKRTNKTGKALETLLLDNAVCLINPPDMYTYIDRKTGTMSCLDICLSTSNIAPLVQITPFKEIGSDHLVMQILVDLKPYKYKWLRRLRFNTTKKSLDQFATVYIPSMLMQPTTTEELAADLTARISEAATSCFHIAGEHTNKRKHTPWWTTECREAVKNRRKSYSIFHRHPTTENWITFKKNSAIAKQIIKRSKIESLREFVTGLSHTVPQSAVWRKIKSFKSGYSPQTFPIVENDNLVLDPKEKAEYFNNCFGEQSNVDPLDKPFVQTIEEKFLEVNLNLNKEICMDEFVSALSNLKDKSPGTDGVTNKMIQMCHPSFKEEILNLFNQCLLTGKMPDIWKFGLVIPILKLGKPPKCKSSYRPITLLSCLGKLLERIMKNRMEQQIEVDNLLNPSQYGFRPKRGTDDILLNITSKIREVLGSKRACCVIYLDLKGAFDKIWRHGLLYKASQMGIVGNGLKWLKDYLEDRTQSVSINGHSSKSIDVVSGVPQGGILSPLLFNIMLHDIPTEDGINLHIFADDITISCCGKSTEEIQCKLQAYLTTLRVWLTEWKFVVNSTKTKMQFFTRRKIKKPELKYGDDIIELVQEHRLLGVILDSPSLTWKSHCTFLAANCSKRIDMMKALSSVKYGASFEILRRFYISYVRSRMVYGAPAFATASHSQLQKLKVVQNSGLRLMMGARKTTPVISLETEASIPPLELHLEYLAAKKYIKMHFTPEGNTEASEIIKKSSVREVFSGFMRKFNVPRINRRPTELYSPFTFNPAVRENIILDQVDPSKFNNYLQANYSNYKYIFTDGSRRDIPNQSVASGMFDPAKMKAISWKIHPDHTVLAAEMFAILNAMLYIESESHNSWVIFTDSLTSLQILQGDSQTYKETVDKIKQKMIALQKNKIVIIHWVKAHSGITGNEIADKVANLGHDLQKSTVYNLHLEEILSNLHRGLKERWQNRWDYLVNTTGKGKHLHDIRNEVQTPTPVDTGRRRADVAIFRLRLGHAGLNSYLYNIRMSDTELCANCGVRDTIEHYLLDCELYDHQRGVLYTEIVTTIRKIPPLTVKLALGGENFTASMNKKIMKALAKYLETTDRLETI